MRVNSPLIRWIHCSSLRMLTASGVHSRSCSRYAESSAGSSKPCAEKSDGGVDPCWIGRAEMAALPGTPDKNSAGARFLEPTLWVTSSPLLPPQMTRLKDRRTRMSRPKVTSVIACSRTKLRGKALGMNAGGAGITLWWRAGGRLSRRFRAVPASASEIRSHDAARSDNAPRPGT